MHAIALPPNEDVHEAAKDEDKEAGVQSSTNVGEVPLGLNKDCSQKRLNAFYSLLINLEGEGSQANNHSSCEEECLVGIFHSTFLQSLAVYHSLLRLICEAIREGFRKNSRF